MIQDEALAARIAAYLTRHIGAHEVIGLHRIHGGASRETFRVRVRAGGAERGIIVRRDPASTLIETDRAVEFGAYRLFHGGPVPVPEPIALELDPAHLDRPFFVMSEVEGGQAASILAGDPYGPHAEDIGRQFWTILGHIHRMRAEDAQALGRPPAPDSAWLEALAHWERVIAEDERHPQPVAHAALRWLKRTPPPPAQRVAVVHGDYRTGNFLHDGQGRIRAILDWEMAHLGDPLEDVAWALDPLWAHHNPERPAGMIARPVAVRLWEEASGLTADPAALAWWEVFASLKGLAIWMSAAAEFADGKNTDPVQAFSGWYCLAFHTHRLAALLAAKEAA